MAKNDEKMIFGIGFDLATGVDEVIKQWNSKEAKRIQKAIDARPFKIKLDFDANGIKMQDFKRWMALSREAEKLERERIKNAREWQKVADQQAMAETRRANATNESNARIERQNRKAEASEKRKRDAVERTNEAYKRQGGYLQRLFQRMVAYASVTQAFSFIRNIREVTAEFELQRVALGSIIGDLNEANAMFEQIKAAAVKSPFQIKELVTYTKQLAAYKIESDELFETTQRLADISAGLGVGMERLVLAYGQIRATGYLRASEVRQLTEAGIPIVEELAKKMSDLRGETVSAAEVMGMISERAISFGMVKEVFDDMTSAGGMFYKMQEKQAETLAGQWSNLQDAISIMYEEIGNTEGVNNSIKGAIGLVKSLAENWRVVGDVAVWSVGAAMGYAKVIKPISELIQKHRLLNKAKEMEMRIEKDLERIRSLNAHKELFADDAEYVQWADQEIDRLQGLVNKHKEIASEARKSATALKGFGGALKSIGSFIKANWVGILITAVTALVSWLISARQEANRLNKELAKIGTEGALQADQSVRNFERLALAIRESADGSAKQTEALEEMKRAYGEFLPSQDKSIINLVREKDGYNAVTQAIREKIALQIQEQKLNTIASEYGSQFTKWEGKLKESPFFKEFSKEEISLIISDIKNAVNDGLIATTNDIEDNMNKVRDIIHNITDSFISQDNLQRLFTGGTLYKGYVTELIKTQEAYNAQIQEVENSMESATGSLGKYTQAYKDFKEELKDVTGTGEKFSFEWNESKTKAEIKAYNEFIGNLLAKEGIKFDIGEAIDFKGLYEALGDNYPQLKQVVTKIQGEYEKLVPKDLEKLIKEQFSTLAIKYGASLDKLQHYFKSADQSTQDWVKTLKEAKTELGNQIFDAKKLDKDTTALEAQKQVIEAMITAWDNSEKTQKAGAKSAEQLLKDELSTVEKIYKRYQDLRKLKSETDTQSILAKEFKGVSLTTLSKAYSPKQMLEVYEKALAEAQRLGKKDLVLEIQTKLGEFNVDEQQRKLEKELKDLSDQLSRTKTAKEFFDRMLGMTGDKELSATLTMSVYGIEKPEGELSEFFAKQLAKDMQKQIQEYLPSIDISSAINEATSEIDPVKLKGIVDALDPLKAGQTNIDAVKKLIKEMIDGNAKYLESLYDSYEKFLDYEHRKTIVAEREAKERKKIEEQNIPENEKKKLTEASKKRESAEKLKIDIEQFKAGEEYVKIFEEIENLSTMSIGRLMRALDKFMKDNAAVLAENPEQLKTLLGEYQKLYEGLITRNPFRAIVDGLKEYHYATKDVISARKKLKKAEDSGDEAKIASAETQLADALDKQQKALNKQVKGYQAASSAISNFGSIITDITEILGIVEDSEAGAFIKDLVKWLGVMATVLNTVAAILVVINTASAPFLAVAASIAAIAASISYFANAKVRKANEEIERQQELLDNLAYSYERLGKAQEKAFGSEYISNYQQRMENLQAQQEAYLKQAEAERSKGKKADEDKIKEYEEQARATADAIKDMQSELSEYFLGTDLTSAARDFANAWIEAYKEFGSTTDAMKEKFQDMIQNMVVESFAAKVMQTALQPIFDEIDKMSEDGALDMSEASKVADMTKVAVGNIDVGMTNLMDALSQAGISVRGMGSDMTGISRDIATASEESILGLAAGINTQNFYISQVPTKLDTIIGLLRGDGAMSQGSAITLQDVMIAQNQFLSHLPTIAQHTAETVAECKQIVAETRRTADALERVIKPDGTRTTYKMNVVTSYQG